MHTLSADYYCSTSVFEAQKQALFARSYQLLPPIGSPAWEPYTLLSGVLDAALLLPPQTVRETFPYALSNVCTHRGAILYQEPVTASKILRCPYHGRSFNLQGQCLAMPGFEQVKDFPCADDHLPRVALHRWHFLEALALFSPDYPFADWVAPLNERLGFLPFADFVFSPNHSRSYDLAANWMLYCDNYLEGLHIPFVHPALFKALDFQAYETHVLAHGVLQIGLADPHAVAFDLPADHPDAGKRVAAFYFWLFPNLMLNFYPWGLSVNVVEPVGVERSRIRYDIWVQRPELLQQGAGGDTDTTEKEDHGVVLRVQAGLKSPLYQRGRYAPVMEKGLRYFHERLRAHVPESPRSQADAMIY